MHPLHTELIITCHKTGQEVIVHKDCFFCKNEQLRSVGMTHLNCKNYKITVDCNNQIFTPKVLILCPLNNPNPKVKVHQSLDVCFKCSEFLFLTFYGQAIRLTCKVSIALPEPDDKPQPNGLLQGEISGKSLQQPLC